MVSPRAHITRIVHPMQALTSMKVDHSNTHTCYSIRRCLIATLVVNLDEFLEFQQTFQDIPWGGCMLEGCIHSLDWTTGLDHWIDIFWFLHMMHGLIDSYRLRGLKGQQPW